MWAGQAAARNPELTERLIASYHLNEPLYIQFYYYVIDLLHGNLGFSPISKRPIIDDLAEYFPNTIELAIFTLLLSTLVGIVLGILSAVRKDRPIDYAGRITSLIGVAIPEFWLGLLMQLVFFYTLGIFPAGGMMDEAVAIRYPVQRITGMILFDALLTANWHALTDHLLHMIMPAIALALPCIAVLSRMVRSCMLEVMHKDYIRTARAFGYAERVVTFKHALRNAIVPSVTVIGTNFGVLMSGAVVIETVFYWPGIGRYLTNAIFLADFPAIVATTQIIGLVYIFANLTVDLLYAILDPRIRLG
jgi:peptide/nickel transport system permease protein